MQMSHLTGGRVTGKKGGNIETIERLSYEELADLQVS